MTDILNTSIMVTAGRQWQLLKQLLETTRTIFKQNTTSHNVCYYEKHF